MSSPASTAAPVGQEQSPARPTKEQCDALQREYKACAALQYDRWLHPKKHQGAKADYDECVDAFEGWKKCILGSRAP